MEEVNYPENVAYFYKHDKVAGIKRCILARTSNYSNEVLLSKKVPRFCLNFFKSGSSVLSAARIGVQRFATRWAIYFVSFEGKNSLPKIKAGKWSLQVICVWETKWKGNKTALSLRVIRPWCSWGIKCIVQHRFIQSINEVCRIY